MRSLAAALVLIGSCVPAFAQEDAEGAKDHPVLARMAGFYLSNAEEQEFASHEFTLGDEMQAVEGRYWRLEYWLKDGVKNPGALAVARNYSNAMVAKKGRRIYEAVDPGGGTRPVADNATEDGRAKNRRVELHRK